MADEKQTNPNTTEPSADAAEAPINQEPATGQVADTEATAEAPPTAADAANAAAAGAATDAAADAANAAAADAAADAAAAGAAAGAAADAAKASGQFMPTDEKKGIAEQFRIIKQRRLLRKDLKSKGITSRKDFNAIAESLGLVLWKISPFTIWLHHALKGLIAGMGLKWLAGAAAAGLVTMFLFSAITEEKGSFTINLTGDMLQKGFALSDTVGFEEEMTRLRADKLKDVNNITISDIDPNVDKVDGPHNGENYFAYTFYIKNVSDKSASYAYFLRMTSETLNVTSAAWIMLYEDGKQITYSRPRSDTGGAEALENFDTPLHFTQDAYKTDQYYSYSRDGDTLYGIKTTPYANENTVAQGIVVDVPPGGVHKYTVVIWLEGYDPDCVDAIFGGYAKFQMDFEFVKDKNDRSIFDGVYRTEYDKYDPYKEEDESAATEAAGEGEPPNS